MTVCPECARPVEAGSQFCTRCGASLPDTGELSYFQTLFRDETEPEPPSAPEPTPPGPDPEALDATRVRPAGFPPAPPTRVEPTPMAPAAAQPPPRGDAPGRRGAEPKSSRKGLWIIVCAALAVMGIVAVLVALSVRGADEETRPSAGSPTPTTTTTQSPQISRGGPALPSGATPCTSEVGIGQNTTCEFALNVARAVWAAGPADPLRVKAHSPVTNRTYEMNCTRGDWIRCTGGNNATVYVLPR